MIRLEDVSYTYPQSKKPVLEDITLDINEGEFLAVVGRNGSGKSTLAKLLNGLKTPNPGRVIVDGLNTINKSDQIKIRQKVGLLLPSPDNQIIFNMVEEDVAFGPENLGLPSNEIRYRVDTALKMVSMEEFKKHPPYLLSGGQKQKVALAGLLALMPKYLVLDEPTSMLDSKSQQEIMETILHIKASTNTTIILITHNLKEVVEADKVLLLNDGRIQAQIKPNQLYKYSKELLNSGVEALEITSYINNLKEAGINNLSEDILRVDELVDELCRLR